MGATVAIVGYNSKIKTLVLWSPLLNTKIQYERYKEFEEEFKRKEFVIRKRKIDDKKVRVGYGLYKEWKNLNIVPFRETINCPVLAIIAEKDELCNQKRNLEMFKLIPNHKNKLVIVANADHDFLNAEIASKVIELTRKWLRKWLE